MATIGDARAFENAPQLSAWLGPSPTQQSSGGKSRPGHISYRGVSYLRTLLIQGARRSLQRAKAVTEARSTPEQIWIRDPSGRLPFGKRPDAIANKHVRLRTRIQAARQLPVFPIH